ncbi:MAG: Mo-dependent nitrogenase C-terminal domain-containing protein [Coleofasciculus sp. S288]|nr:Mo-dependent nitrogenase C-terminal domain-containing protein [Coleofasciculus sp. S288]
MSVLNQSSFGNSPLSPVRQWLEAIEIHNPKVARFLCKLIPAQCPFERDIKLFERTVAHIPPLCKLNPLYEQLIGLRFRSLCYLADECGEDIAAYL